LGEASCTGGVALGNGDHAFGDDFEDAHENQREKKGDDHFRQNTVEEILQVIEPFVVQGGEKLPVCF
jgi:hypothetical protein